MPHYCVLPEVRVSSSLPQVELLKQLFLLHLLTHSVTPPASTLSGWFLCVWGGGGGGGVRQNSLTVNWSQTKTLTLVSVHMYYCVPGIYSFTFLKPVITAEMKPDRGRGRRNRTCLYLNNHKNLRFWKWSLAEKCLE